MRLPDFMDPARSAGAQVAVVLIASVALGALWFAAHNTPPARPHPVTSDTDCRTTGDRQCGSDVTWQAPGTYPAPDGGTYTVTLVTPYEACLAAAGIPGPSGFASEVCEPVAPGFEHPPTVTRVDGGCVLLNRRERYCPAKP